MQQQARDMEVQQLPFENHDVAEVVWNLANARIQPIMWRRSSSIFQGDHGKQKRFDGQIAFQLSKRDSSYPQMRSIESMNSESKLIRHESFTGVKLHSFHCVGMRWRKQKA